MVVEEVMVGYVSVATGNRGARVPMAMTIGYVVQHCIDELGGGEEMP
jgi:hypothetical protein